MAGPIRAVRDWWGRRQGASGQSRGSAAAEFLARRQQREAELLRMCQDAGIALQNTFDQSARFGRGEDWEPTTICARDYAQHMHVAPARPRRIRFQYSPSQMVYEFWADRIKAFEIRREVIAYHPIEELPRTIEHECRAAGFSDEETEMAIMIFLRYFNLFPRATGRTAANDRADALSYAFATMGTPKEAREKARKLLMRYLSDQQKTDLNSQGFFYAVGGTTGSLYRIRASESTNAREFNILQYRGTLPTDVNRPMCFGPMGADLPYYDFILGQKLALECDEETALAKANYGDWSDSRGAGGSNPRHLAVRRLPPIDSLYPPISVAYYD